MILDTDEARKEWGGVVGKRERGLPFLYHRHLVPILETETLSEQPPRGSWNLTLHLDIKKCSACVIGHPPCPGGPTRCCQKTVTNQIEGAVEKKGGGGCGAFSR